MVLTVLGACDVIGPAGPPLIDCDVWASCPGALAIHTEVVQSGFRRQHPDRYVPGDSFIVRIRVQNRAKVRSDSLFVSYSAVGVRGHGILGDSATKPGGWRYPVVVLGAGQATEVIDTLIVGGYTFDRPTRMAFYVADWTTSEPVDFQLSGTVHFPIATSGYAFEVVTGPPGLQETVQHGNHTHTATRIRHKTETGVLGRISNPYQLPIDPIPFGHCLWDGDHGYVCGSAPTDMTRLEAGHEAYVEYIFNFDTEGHYHDWWAQDFTQFTVCPENGYSWIAQCHWVDVLVTANFEADCVVVSQAPVGIAVRDETPECGRWKNGSAYRFEARKGELYKVTLLSAGVAEVFLSSRDGAHFNKPKVTELLIPEDGTYYVVVKHTTAVRFRLDKVS
jgi:hypothetical protein